MDASDAAMSGFRILHRYLGMKNLADYLAARHTLLGAAYLDIATVVDVGANKGRRSRELRRKFPAARLVCVEPIPAMAQKLRRWARPHTDQVTVVEAALAAAPATASFYVSRRKSIWSTLHAPPAERASEFEEIDVDVQTLDTMSERLGLKGPFLVKIDTEGHDLEVIRGGAQTLAQTSALIAEVPMSRPGGSANSFETFVDELRPQGFLFAGIVRGGYGAGRLHVADVLFVKQEAAGAIVDAIRARRKR